MTTQATNTLINKKFSQIIKHISTRYQARPVGTPQKPTPPKK